MPLLLEHWKPIPGWEDLYEVSTTGRIRRIVASGKARAGALMTGSLQSRGYRAVCLSRNNKFTRYYVHRIVCAAFLGPCPDGIEVNHIDANKLNNRLSNLEYLTHAANMKHAHNAGIFRKNFRRKLLPHEIQEIRASDRSLSCSVVVEQYGISINTVARVRSGKAWSWIR